jgi:chromosome partitioning protein
VITVINLKGGVAKTFTVWTIAGVLEERRRRVLLIDCDAQGNLTGSCLTDIGDQPGVEAFFDPAAEPDAAMLIRKTSFAHIDIIPATTRLSRFDLPDRAQWEKSDLQRALADPLAKLRGQYDVILIDCPPRLSVVSYAALCASDFALVPLEAADYGAQGIAQVNAAIAEVRRRHNPRLELLGYLISRYKQRRAYQQTYLDRMIAHFGKKVFPEPIPDLAYYEQSVCDRTPIVFHRPRSKAADIARRLVDEIDRRIQAFPGRRQQRGRQGVPEASVVAV